MLAMTEKNVRASSSEDSDNSSVNASSPIVSKRQPNITNQLVSMGFANPHRISSTLQGGVWRALCPVDATAASHIPCIIKITDKQLHSNGQAVINNKQYSVREDILKEQAILKYVTQKPDCPDSIVKFLSFSECQRNYVLVMEDGGVSLFDFVKRGHIFIQKGLLDRDHWLELVRVVFSEMVRCVDYLHRQQVAHFDISLENWVINDVEVASHTSIVDGQEVTKLTLDIDDIRVKLIDFGLAEHYQASSTTTTKVCGKSQYQSPENISRKTAFDAMKNDVWALGMSLYLMTAGQGPWIAATSSEATFQYAMSSSVVHLIKAFKIFHYFDDFTIRLLHHMLRYEPERISLTTARQFIDAYSYACSVLHCEASAALADDGSAQ